MPQVSVNLDMPNDTGGVKSPVTLFLSPCFPSERDPQLTSDYSPTKGLAWYLNIAQVAEGNSKSIFFITEVERVHLYLVE